MINPDFQLGFHMELRKIAQMMAMPTGTQPQVPAVQQVNAAQGQVNSGQFPRPPQNPGQLMGTGAGGQQFADMANGPNPGTRPPGAA